MKRILPGIVVLLYLVIFSALGQTVPSINSGNPVFPFPQFLPYTHADGTKLSNLADNNSEGVPHAELEQRIRDGWQIMCNNINPIPGVKVGGVQYLRSEAPLDCHCAEAYGYYLLAAAYMGDKNVYDGLYMYYHDNSFNGVTRFIDGVENPYGGVAKGLSYAGSFGGGDAANPRGGGISGNSAADGDHDIGLATLVAYKQWGERSGIIANGKEINYKEEALNYIRAMADTAVYKLAGNILKYTSGIIGFDGYIKGGDFGNELTNFAQSGYKGMMPQISGGASNDYFDYFAPAYYRQFGDWLTSINERPWLIDQYRRGESSSDWLMGQHYASGPQKIPFVGQVFLSDSNVPTFTNYNMGEDFRAAWRTILNYVWHGNPSYSWDPVTHELKPGVSNSYQRDMAIRAARFMKNPQDTPWSNPCRVIKSVPLTYTGPTTVVADYDLNGKEKNTLTLNWMHGTFSPSAVVAQDFSLMGDMFRQCAIEWDSDDPGYLNSRPKYYHEWFRMLGMLVLTGNHHAPLAMNSVANLKVYHAVDKTVAFNNDLVTFTIDYRNYGTKDATASKIFFGIPPDLTFISSSKPSKITGNNISWDLGTVPGFKTGGLDATKGSFTVTFKLSPTSSGRYSIKPEIVCDNGSGWVSNEYPNRITSVMERNSVDVIKRALKISKTANFPVFNPGDTLTYTIDFTNSSEAGWINGGRPGVNFSFAHSVENPASDDQNDFKFRIFHDAAEPYIDYGNYRFSYFLNETSMKCIANSSDCPLGWGIYNTIYEGGDKTGVQFLRESIVPGSDSNGAWNQRIAIKFAPQLATITEHLQNYYLLRNRIKEGGMAPLKGVWQLYTSSRANIVWTDDWSWDAKASEGDEGLFYPITPDVTDPFSAPKVVNKWNKSTCQTASKTVSKVLVEEWDGYVWRRIFGNGPLPGRDINNVVVTDTIPSGLAFAGFTGTNPFGIAPTYDSTKRIITWTIPRLLINQSGKISYLARAFMPSSKTCPTDDEKIISKAWIKGEAESPFADIDTITISCKKVIVCNGLPNFTISTDKVNYVPTDTVITYNLSYTQTEGSIGTSALNSISDWTLQSGAGVTVSGGNLASTTNSNFLITHNYSHGTNTIGDGILGRLDVTKFARVGLALRYDPVTKTGLYLAFRLEDAVTKVYVYNASGILVTSGEIPSSQAKFDFQIQLKGSRLDMWIGNAPFSGPSDLTLNGLLVQAGYAGIVHGSIIGGDNYAVHKLLFWKAHLDSGFDIVLNNPLPGGITAASSITNGGVVSSTGINWTFSTAGVPVLFNTKFEVSWKGKVKDCKSGLNDKAFISMLGQPRNFLQSCVLVSCSSTVVDVPIELNLYGQNTQQNTILLNWLTTSVQNTAYFEVLQSIGGNTWSRINVVPVSGTNLSYSFEDLKPLNGISYYQINQVLNDSTAVASPIINMGRSSSLTFLIENKGGLPLLTWLSNESNTDHYEVLRSKDGFIWEMISTTKPEGSGTVYTYLDASPVSGKGYYEIKQVLTNGFSYTSIVIVFETATGVLESQDKQLKVFPNPISSQLFVNWQSPGNTYDLQLYSSLGSLVYSQKGLSANHTEVVQLSDELASGTYILKVVGENNILHRQVIKK